jgi:hypothetical protein
MKAIISGPKRMPHWDDPRDPWPHMHIELDLPGLPAVGEHITLNSGGTFKVRRRFWYVEGPENQAWFDIDARYNTDEGVFDVVYLDVLPADYDEPFTYDKAIAEGTVRGQEQAAAEVEKLLGLAAAPGVDPASALAMLREWCRDGAARARERAEQAARHCELATRILADLQREREHDDSESPRETCAVCGSPLDRTDANGRDDEFVHLDDGHEDHAPVRAEPGAQ